jgi:hypothetical protein
MKKFCDKHYVAFEAAEGCLDCGAKEAEKLLAAKVELPSKGHYLCNEPKYIGSLTNIIGQATFNEPGLIDEATKSQLKTLNNPCGEVKSHQDFMPTPKTYKKLINAMAKAGYSYKGGIL